jgi:hypothetical protein
MRRLTISLILLSLALGASLLVEANLAIREQMAVQADEASLVAGLDGGWAAPVVIESDHYQRLR